MINIPKNTAPEGFAFNSQGHLVPLDKVKTSDSIESTLVMEMIEKAVNLNHGLTLFKDHCFDEINTLLEMLAEQYSVKKGGKKGNVTLQSYDGLFKVQMSVSEFFEFGPQLQIAKQLIDECILEWGAGANANIKALVDHAFRVDKKNQVNTKDILGLRRLDIKDEKWQEAMTAISDSMRVQSSKEYVRFYYRPSSNDDFKAITLDIAKA